MPAIPPQRRITEVNLGTDNIEDSRDRGNIREFLYYVNRFDNLIKETLITHDTLHVDEEKWLQLSNYRHSAHALEEAIRRGGHNAGWNSARLLIGILKVLQEHGRLGD